MLAVSGWQKRKGGCLHEHARALARPQPVPPGPGSHSASVQGNSIRLESSSTHALRPRTPPTLQVCGKANMDAMYAAKSLDIPRFAFISINEFKMPAGWHMEDFLLKGYFQGKRDAEKVLFDVFPDTGVALRPGMIYGNRKIGSASVPLGAVGSPWASVRGCWCGEWGRVGLLGCRVWGKGVCWPRGVGGGMHGWVDGRWVSHARFVLDTGLDRFPFLTRPPAAAQDAAHQVDGTGAHRRRHVCAPAQRAQCGPGRRRGRAGRPGPGRRHGRGEWRGSGLGGAGVG